jgi:hypothetical protein
LHKKPALSRETLKPSSIREFHGYILFKYTHGCAVGEIYRSGDLGFEIKIPRINGSDTRSFHQIVFTNKCLAIESNTRFHTAYFCFCGNRLRALWRCHTRLEE